MHCDYCGQEPDRIQRGLALLAWLDTLKAQVHLDELVKDARACLPVPEFLTQGDVERQHVLAMIASAEAAMEPHAAGLRQCGP